MKILVVGQGGREHALVWSLAKNRRVQKIWAAPGNAGTRHQAESVAISSGDINALARFAKEKRADLTVVGPEAPLVEGIVDHFQDQGLPIFGPGKEASRMEGSKSFAKDVMREAGVPTARSRTFTEKGPAEDFARTLGLPVVIKADGLAAGKGVRICEGYEAISSTLSDMIDAKCFGKAGEKVVVEEFLSGEECSILALTDGDGCLLLAPSQDHKRLSDGDKGPNTGGMGAYSPVPFIDETLVAKIREEIFLPVIRTLAKRGTVYKGVLYAGLVLTESGPKVLEFNCRFGDPEAQAVLPRLKTDLAGLLMEVCEGRLRTRSVAWDPRAAVCVVIASGGYPASYQKGKPIRGLDSVGQTQDLVVFHAGTRPGKDKQEVLTDGGRVLGVTGLGADLGRAKKRAYRAVEQIQFENMIYRRDISNRAGNPSAREREIA